MKICCDMRVVEDNFLKDLPHPENTEVVNIRMTEEYPRLLKHLSENDNFLSRLRKQHPNNHIRWRELCKHDGYLLEWLFEHGDCLPSELEVHLSTSCLLNCWYCCSPYPSVETSQIRKLLAERVAQYIIQLNGILRTVLFSGGREPLQDSHLFALAQQAQSCGMTTKLNTSGVTSLSQNKLSRIATVMDYISVSLDADTVELFNAMKGTVLSDKDFRGVLHEIKVANQVNCGARIDLVVLVTPENRGRLHQLCGLAKQLGCAAIRFRRLKGLGEAPRSVLDDIRSYNNGLFAPGLLQQLDALKLVFSDNSFEVLWNQEDFLITSERVEFNAGAGCYSCFRKLVISAAGGVHPCPLKAYATSEGSHGIQLLPEGRTILDYPNFQDMWSATLAKRQVLVDSACEACFIADRYLNNCVQRLHRDYNRGVRLHEHPLAKT